MSRLPPNASQECIKKCSPAAALVTLIVGQKVTASVDSLGTLSAYLQSKSSVAPRLRQSVGKTRKAYY